MELAADSAMHAHTETVRVDSQIVILNLFSLSQFRRNATGVILHRHGILPLIRVVFHLRHKAVSHIEMKTHDVSETEG